MKFNLKIERKAKKAVNHKGAKAFVLTPGLELYTAVATDSLNDQFYQKRTDWLKRMRELLAVTAR
jgi:60 kDa SS-A/Ro ribonucleoprotein